MMPSPTNASQIKILLVLIAASILAPFVDAFRSSVIATPPAVSPFDLPTEGNNRLHPIKPNETAEASASRVFGEKMIMSQRKFEYDLGLGKNKPVTDKGLGETPLVDTNLAPTQFLVEHESVRPCPSPLNSDSESLTRNTKGLEKKRKNLPKVQHRRHSEDVLHIRDRHSIENAIYDYNDDNLSHPVIAPVNCFSAGCNGRAAKLDVNTIWVEMMLHNEKKMSLAK